MLYLNIMANNFLPKELSSLKHKGDIIQRSESLLSGSVTVLCLVL